MPILDMSKNSRFKVYTCIVFPNFVKITVNKVQLLSQFMKHPMTLRRSKFCTRSKLDISRLCPSQEAKEKLLTKLTRRVRSRI